MRPALTGTDRYVLRRRIGAGGMGVVYEALDRERDTTVALKMLQNVSPKGIARFKNEFRALADVIHPSLVALYELVADQEAFFFTMELIDGVSFLRYVRPSDEPEPDPTESPTSATRPIADATVAGTPGAKAGAASPSTPETTTTGTLDLRRLRLAMRQLAEAVAAIHDAGMLHRDLKPSNVLVTDSGRLAVLDFGLVTAVADEDSQPEDRPLVGTVAYMAPEQGARQPLTPASDWYAVGAMLYQALTGRPPFIGGQHDVLLDKQQFEPPPPSQIAPGVPGDLDALCAELLRRDPARRPPGREVLRRLGSRAMTTPALSTTTRSQGAQAVLVGREWHRGVLDEAYATTRKGDAVVIYVRGESGMGKSALVRGFLDDMTESAVILRGRCYERESVPFKAVDSIVDALTTYLLRISALEAEGLMPRDALALARVFPVLRQVDAFTTSRRRAIATRDPRELRRLAFGALREIFTRIADRKPLILAIDDLQWGDIDSATLLGSMLRHPEPPAMLVLGCCRTEDVAASPFIEELRALTGDTGLDVRDIEVGPLSREEARELALIHLSERSGAAAHADRVAAESGGSPFFVEELARHLLSTGPGAGGLSLDEALRGRLNRLPEPAGRLLATVAVAGRPIAQPLVLRAAEVSDPAALSLLKAGSFVRTRTTAGERFVESYHDRVRETVVAMLSDGELVNRHRRLARVIEASPHPDAEALAIHFEGAREPERAVEYAEIAAGRAADSLAFDQAARLYQLALNLTDDNDRIQRLQRSRGDALTNIGRGVDAAEAYLAAVAAGPDTAEAVDLKRRAAEELLRSGHIEPGIDLLDEVLAAFGLRLSRTPGRALASLLARRLRFRLRGLRFKERDASEIPASQLRRIDATFAVSAGIGMVDAIRAASFNTQHLLMALEAGEPARIVMGLVGEACFQALRGGAKRARADAILAQAEELAARVGDPTARAFVAGGAGVCAFQYGDWARSVEQCDAGARILREECTGHAWEHATLRLFSAYGLAFTGRIRALNELVTQELSSAAERGDLYADVSFRVSMGFYGFLGDDDPHGARADIDDALQSWVTGRYDLQRWAALLAHLTVDGYLDDPDHGIVRAREELPQIKRALMWGTQVMRVHHRAFLARLHLRAGARDGDVTRLRAARRCARKLAAERIPYAEGYAALLRAGLASIDRDADRARDQLELAQRRFEETDMAINVAAVQIRRGELIGGDEGAELIEAGTSYITGQGLPNIERVIATVAPGC